MIFPRPFPGTLSACLLACALLGGCQTLNEFDWKDRGGAGPVAMDGSPLTAQVVDRLAATPMTMNQQIKVGLLRDNRIRLSGSVTSDSSASEAVRISQQVDGVRDVVDTISVR